MFASTLKFLLDVSRPLLPANLILSIDNVGLAVHPSSPGCGNAQGVALPICVIAILRRGAFHLFDSHIWNLRATAERDSAVVANRDRELRVFSHRMRPIRRPEVPLRGMIGELGASESVGGRALREGLGFLGEEEVLGRPVRIDWSDSRENIA